MIYSIDIWNEEKYLPTKRCRKLRKRFVKSSVEVEVKELLAEEFPVAFIVHEYKSVYENAKSYYDFDGSGDFRMFSEEIRTFKGNLYKPIRVTHGAAVSMCFEPLNYIKTALKNYEPYWKYAEDFSEESIIKETNFSECRNVVLKKAEKYVIFNGKVWVKCNEPMYVIQTFGLGHNHGGTGFFIDYFYNSNIPNTNYFTALERDKAIAYGKAVAAKRGDTESIEGMGNYDIIEVVMPEMVRRNPRKEHGTGNEFINSIEEMIEGTESVAEAGWLTMAMSFTNLI